MRHCARRSVMFLHVGILAALAAATAPPVLAAAESASAAPRTLTLARLFPGASFDPQIPPPETFFGFAAGERPVRHADLIRYFEALAAASKRARLIDYAQSYEHRRLVDLVVSDETTIARLDAFREEHARLMDPRTRAADADRAALANAKAVAWMAYGIHGDELSSTDAAALLAYRLVAGEDAAAQALRSELVVLIDPCENPDGRERFLSLTTAFAHAAPNPDTEDLSHTTVWPWGRGNHYLFDLNRDWISMIQPESRRPLVIASWLPQLVVDSHEMGPDDTYLFSPARAPFNPHKPAYLQTWADRFAADQAKALDARGYAYYTREWNEEFAPEYGSSWGSYHGAVGILYEMAGVEGTLVRQRPGTLRTYAQTVEHQLASSLANLETLRANRTELLAGFVAARRDAVRRGATGPVRAWVLPRGRYPERTDALAALLRGQGLEVLRLAGRARADGLRDARTGEPAAGELAAGSWMIPMDQPAGALARALLDPHTPMSAEFLREEREHIERGKGTRLYDVTAWSLPLSFGVEALWGATKPAGDWRADDAPAPKGALEDAAAPFGYVIDGASDAASFALADLLQRGLAVRLAEKPFRVAGRSYQPGALLVKREGAPADLAAQLAEVAQSCGVVVTAVTTAKAEEGADLGGDYFHPLVAPRIGVWTGTAVNPSSYGELWQLLDEQMHLRFTALDLARFSSTDLSRYNVLVFPPLWGGGEGRRALLGKDGGERLRRWIEAGGTAIGLAGGAELLADKSLGLTATRLRRQALETFPPAVWGLGADAAGEAGLFRAAGIRAPSADKDQPDAAGAKETADKSKRAERAPTPAPVRRTSPYDIAPVIGPGAKPFVAGVDLGAPPEPQPVELAKWLKPLLPPGKDKPEAADLEGADERLRRFAPRGSFLRVELDRDLWLNWGMPDAVDALVDASDALVAAPPVEVAARFADVDRLHLGGLLWPEAAARIARTAYLTREGVGRGQVILFLDDPDFRAWTLGPRRLLLNALLYGPGLGTRWSSPW